jgi:hypothetical protein
MSARTLLGAIAVLVAASFVVSCASDSARSVAPMRTGVRALAGGRPEGLPDPQSSTDSLRDGTDWPPRFTVVATSWAEMGWQYASVRSNMWWGAVQSCDDAVPQRRVGQEYDGSYFLSDPQHASVSVSVPTAEINGAWAKVHVETRHVFYDGPLGPSYAEEYITTRDECVQAPPLPPTVSIVGHSSVRANASCSWSVSVSGTSPFTYYWTKDGGYIGSGSEVTTSFAVSGTLYVQVWNANGSAYDSKSITVSPSAPECLF